MWICNPTLINTQAEYDAGIAAELAERQAAAVVQAGQQGRTQMELEESRMYTMQDAANDVAAGLRPDFVTSPEGGIPFYAASQVSRDYCQKVACGEISQAEAGPENLYACSLAYGAMLSTNCGPKPAAPMVQYIPVESPAIAQRPTDSVQPLTTQTLTQPIPDITQAFVNITDEETTPSLWCQLNNAIASSPLCAAAALVGLFLVLRRK